MPRTLKAIIAIGLLTALLAGIDWAEVPSRLARFSWITVTVVLLAVAAQFLASAWKWWCSMRLHDITLPFGLALRFFCIGFFFNNFLPSAIGGDAYRIYRTIPFAPDKFRALSAVVVERAVGLLVMLGLGLICALTLDTSHPVVRAYIVLSFGIIGGCAVALLLHRSGLLRPLTDRLRRFKGFTAVEASAQSVLRLRMEWVWFLAASALFQTLAAVILYVLFNDAGVRFNLSESMLAAAASGIASVLPISINGIGVVEGAIAGTAVGLGADYDPALIAAIALRLLVLPANAACGLIYLFENSGRRAVRPAAPRMQ